MILKGNFLWKGVLIVIGLLWAGQASALTTPAGFQVETVTSGLNLPTTFAFAPDGRIFIAEKNGTVRLYKNGTLQAAPVYVIPRINDYADHGLLGLALDPQFAQNGYMYLSYTYENTPGVNYSGPKTGQIVRVTVEGDTANDSSKVVLVGQVTGDASNPSCENYAVTADCIPSDSQTHSMGGLRFGPDGKLYATIGDGAGFESADPKAMRALNVDSLAGKLLRINRDGTAPADNPYYNGNANANRSKVWSYGLRNAFRFNWRPSNGALYLADVGWMRFEELNNAQSGNNFGWPCREGYESVPEYNCATANYVNPMYAYDHSPGSGAIAGGAYPLNNIYPQSYMGSFYVADYAQNWIKKFNIGENNVVNSVEEFITDAGGPVDILAGNDGTIYYMSIYTGELRRIIYSNANRSPVVQLASDKNYAPVPMTTNFSSNGSYDPDGDPLSYAWTFGDGGTSNEANPSHTYNSANTYTVSLAVSDGRGGSDTKSITVHPGQTPPATVLDPRHVRTTVAPLPTYIGRDSVVTTTITNDGGGSDPFIVDIEIYDSNVVLAAKKFYDSQVVSAGTSRDFSLTWFPPHIGEFVVKIGLFRNDWGQLYEWTDRALVVNVLERSTETPPPPPSNPPPPPTNPPPPPPPTNLIPNPSLETGGARPDSWASGSWGSNSPSFTYPVAGFDGSRGAKVTMTRYASGDAKWFVTPVTVSPDTEYKFSDYYKSTVPTDVVIEYTAANGVHSYIWLGTLPTNANWTKFTKRFTTPANAARATFFHLISKNGELTTDLYSLTSIVDGTTPPPSNPPPPPTNPPPPPAADVIYGDSLATGWVNWSWGSTIDLGATSPVGEGTRSIRIVYQSPWSALYLHRSQFDTSGKTNIIFEVNGGSASGQIIKIVPYDGNGNPIEGTYLAPYIAGGITANTWKTVTVPLADIGAANKVMTGFAIQDGRGLVEAPLYLDFVRFQ